MSQPRLSVAVPWSLSHYIPLNGFHPLYRPLFEACPEDVTLNAWDNIQLSNTLRAEPDTRLAFMKYTQSWERRLRDADPSPQLQEYHDAFFPPNLAATALLPGDLELHHTAAFPSMTRPFVLHCEAFMPVFHPFAGHGGGSIARAQALRPNYERMFASPLCLGIFSHIPETLNALSRFFGSKVIDQKLFDSEIGRCQSFPPRAHPRTPPGTAPGFLFINAANQDPANFFHRGGHIALRAWPAILARYPGAKLLLRCARPEDARLEAHRVDLAFLSREQGRSVIWIAEFLTHPELNRLMGRVHFFLLPSISLHSVSILQAMAAGAVPIVSDTIGTSRYVTHGETGLVLQGVQAAHHIPDAQTGILVEHDARSTELDESLVQQLLQNVIAVLDEPGAYRALQGRTLEAASSFSGAGFAGAFWRQLRGLWTGAEAAAEPIADLQKLRRCLVPVADWPRLFESTPHPMTRIHTGIGQVTELGGAFVHSKPASGMRLHDWSALAEFCRPGAVKLTFASSIGALQGQYLTGSPTGAPASLRRRATQAIARLLFPYPPLYRAAAKILRLLRRLRARFQPPQLPSEPLDIQLLAQNVSGMNIIRAAGQVHAIPQDEGEFSLAKLRKGGYRLCFSGGSMQQVMTMIAEYDSTNHGPPPPATLAEEGVNGLNIIHCADKFFAIPQGEGPFDYRRALANGYSRVVVGESLGEVKGSILSTAP